MAGQKLPPPPVTGIRKGQLVILTNKGATTMGFTIGIAEDVSRRHSITLASGISIGRALIEACRDPTPEDLKALDPPPQKKKPMPRL